MENMIADIRKNAITHGSLPFWSWNDRLREDELRRQINVMHQLGMNGFFMHARGGLETEYLSDEWYSCIKACIDEGKKLGMEAWSYDENGWPSGFAGGILLKDPANHATYLALERSAAFPEGEHLLGVYVLDGRTLKRVSSPDGHDEYLAIRQKFDPTYVDTLNAAVTRKFIEATHAAYKEQLPAEDFGRAMPGFFTDEPQYYRYATPWSEIMPAEFQKRYGYDVLDMLASLFVDCDGDYEFRFDYYRLCHELFINGFVKVIYDWCEANGCRLTGHAVEESSLSGQMWSCGGIMPFYQYEHIPGIDYLGRPLSNDLAHKQLGSVCAQLGKDKALSEMFACCGWDVSPRELKKIAELQYAGGVNMMCQHLYSYSIRGQRKRDYPAHYSEHLPWQPVMGDFNRYFNNLGYTLSLGQEYADTLVIHPIHSAYLTYKRQEDYRSIAELEQKTAALSDLLSQHQVAYHWGDECMMADIARVEGDRLRVGLCSYRYVIVPFCHTLDKSTVALLKEFLAQGGCVCVWQNVPERIEGRLADMSWLRSTVTLDEIMDARASKITLDGHNLPSLREEIRDTAYGRVVYITNLSDEVFRGVRIELSDCPGVWELDLSTLEKKPVYGVLSEGKAVLQVTFEASEAHLFVFSPDAALRDPADIPALPAPIELNRGFRFAVRPENAYTLDTVEVSFDGVNFEHSRPLVAVKDMLLRRRYRGDLYLRYSFELKEMPESIALALEPLVYKSLTVNGRDIVLSDRWWLDRSFRTADILPCLQTGRNEIVTHIDYFQRDYVYYVLYGGVSETLRNCLSFDTEIECVYLVGRFALETDPARFTAGEKETWCYDGSFAVKAQKDEVELSNLVTDGYPFFAGSIEVETVYTYHPGMGTELYIDGRYAVCEVSVNGVHAAQLLFTTHCDLGPYLTEGDNVISLRLFNSNRNLLGPHHREDPEPFFAGPNTYSFENEWDINGEICPAYQSRYAFVRFGVSSGGRTDA